MIRSSTHIVMLYGWRESEGAQAEYHYAKKLGLTISFPVGSNMDFEDFIEMCGGMIIVAVAAALLFSIGLNYGS